jgi:TolB-like protein
VAFFITGNTTFIYKSASVDLRRVAENLSVRFVLEGSFRRSGDRVRVTAQLRYGTTGRRVWSERYDEAARAVKTCQDVLPDICVNDLDRVLLKDDQAMNELRAQLLKAGFPS